MNPHRSRTFRIEARTNQWGQPLDFHLLETRLKGKAIQTRATSPDISDAWYSRAIVRAAIWCPPRSIIDVTRVSPKHRIPLTEWAMKPEFQNPKQSKGTLLYVTWTRPRFKGRNVIETIWDSARDVHGYLNWALKEGVIYPTRGQGHDGRDRYCRDFVDYWCQLLEICPDMTPRNVKFRTGKHALFSAPKPPPVVGMGLC